MEESKKALPCCPLIKLNISIVQNQELAQKSYGFRDRASREVTSSFFEKSTLTHELLTYQKSKECAQQMKDTKQ